MHGLGLLTFLKNFNFLLKILFSLLWFTSMVLLAIPGWILPNQTLAKSVSIIINKPPRFCCLLAQKKLPPLKKFGIPFQNVNNKQINGKSVSMFLCKNHPSFVTPRAWKSDREIFLSLTRETNIRAAFRFYCISSGKPNNKSYIPLSSKTKARKKKFLLWLFQEKNSKIFSLSIKKFFCCLYSSFSVRIFSRVKWKNSFILLNLTKRERERGKGGNIKINP